MSEILNLIKVENSAILQVLRILEHQVDDFSHGESPNFDLLNDSVDFLKSYFDAESKTSEKLLLEKLRHKNAHLAESIKEIDQTYTVLENSINELLSTIDKIAMDAVIPRSWFNDQAKAVINTFHYYIEQKESILLPVTENTLQKNDWNEIKDMVVEDCELGHHTPIEQYRNSLYNNIIGNRA